MFVSDGEIIRANKTLADLCRFADAKDMIGIKSTFLYQDEANYKAFSALVIPKLISDELVELEWQVSCGRHRRPFWVHTLRRDGGRAQPRLCDRLDGWRKWK